MNMEFDDQVTDALDRRVRNVDDLPDWDDLTDRVTQHRRRKTRNRMLAGGAVVAVVLAAGVGVASSTGGDDAGVEVVPPPDSTTVPGQSTTTSSVPFQTQGYGSQVSYMGGYPDPAQIGEFVFERTVGSMNISAYSDKYEELFTDNGYWWWEKPQACRTDSSIAVKFADEHSWTITNLTEYKALRPGEVNMFTAVRYAHDVTTRPGVAVLVQVPKDSVLVRATFADGSVDEMQPVNGIAVLYQMHPAGTDPEALAAVGAHVEALDEDERVIASGDYDPQAQLQTPADCIAPPEPMPEPGEQPADPDAARAEITEVFNFVLDGPTPIEERAEGVDDSHGMEDVAAQLEANGKDQVAAAAVDTHEIVFVSPTRAAVRYDILSFLAQYRDRIGYVNLVDGEWKVARETVCRDLEIVSVHCPE